MGHIMEYLGRFLDKTDPTASLKHAAYALVVVCSCGWLSYDLTVKTIYRDERDEKVQRRGIDSNWCIAFASLLGAVTVGKVVGSGPSPAPTAGAVPTTLVETQKIAPDNSSGRVGTSHGLGGDHDA